MKKSELKSLIKSILVEESMPGSELDWKFLGGGGQPKKLFVGDSVIYGQDDNYYTIESITADEIIMRDNQGRGVRFDMSGRESLNNVYK